jgi:branched-chain amino acid transport system substrate-binding protein
MLKARAKFGLILAVALTAAACGGGDGGDNTASEGAASSGGGASLEGELKIGVINPFSGPNAPGGEAIFEGYEIAAEQANAGEGVLGKRVTLLRGDASAPEQGISEVNRLATSENVDLFAGTYLSGISNTASETALRYGKLYWETNGVAATLTERGLENFARSGPMAEQFAEVAGEAIQDLIPEALGKPAAELKVCVTHEESIYGTSISEGVVEALEEAGAEVTATVAYAPTAPDLGNVVLRCQQGNPDLWVETGYIPDVNLLLRTAEQQGFNPQGTMLIGSGDTRLTLDAVGAETLNGVFVVGYPHFDIQESYAPGAAEFLETYTKKYGGEPTFPQTMTAYAGMQMLFDALNEAESAEPAAVMEVISGWDKPLGTYATGYGAKFDEDKQNTLALPTVLQWQDGETVTVYPQEAKLAEAKIIGTSG